MAESSTVLNMALAVSARLHPAITRWNRLEGRPRAHDFDRALRAELRDALWMLSRQWQMGEFQGDDAGSPVLARACVDVSPINRFQVASGAAVDLTLAEPLEAKVERRRVPLSAGAQYLSLDLRLAVGRRWLKLLERERARPAPAGLLADYRDAYVAQYGVPVPDPTLESDAEVCSHPETWQQAGAAAGRAMDGINFLEHLADPANDPFVGIGAADDDEPKLVALAGRLRGWFAGLITQPPDGEHDGWLPDRLEYQFGCSAPDRAGEFVTRAEEYYHGHLDWYALERRPGETQLGETPQPPQPPERRVHTFVPASIVFEGMPNTRWWAFEDRRTNFGEVRPDTIDLGKLLLLEFGLVYANDWFVLPYTLPVGTVAEVQGIALTNVFNERVWIERVSERPGEGWQRWSLFTLSTETPEQQTPPARLVLLPTAPKVQEGAALEEVALVRDEIANMVWGIEKRVPLPTGASKPGSEAAAEFFNFLQRPFLEKVARLQARRVELGAIPEAERTPAEQDELEQITTELAAALPPEPKAPIRYQVMNTVPEEWIPFIPVHIDKSVRETQFQRAALPRILEGDPDPPVKVRPRTSLMRFGLPRAYFINEEEVPRAGVVISQSYQRTRWVGGSVFTWFGARKQTGRGEGSSSLRFDGLTDTRK
ncbi:MAG: hypothetical protein LC800_05495 [Acidobacteria bacterium]|nr:hypothetical protein [Acidobacteriota bacterium]